MSNEQHLGVRLLHRTTRNLALTDEGRQSLETAQPALAMLEHAVERVRTSKGEIARPFRIVGADDLRSVLWPVR